ncbi:MAG: NADH-quinone oxidoreductase subunit C [Eggerthellaceae bacterium]|nr:NADH-quinone oxidoreductase subunit C [Eggerthellaceae bacterium]
MKFESEFTPIALDELHHEAAVMKVDGWRFIQTHAVNTDNGIDLYYSFMKNGHIKNLKVAGVTKENPVPSITDLFLAAFVFENEARELFGVDMRDIAIDFSGALYAPAIDEPMTIITPEQKAAREKARKAKAAKEAKGDEASAPASAEGAPRIFVMTPERRQRLDAKLATMSPEKVAKVEAALKAREAEAAAAAAGAPARPQKPLRRPLPTLARLRPLLWKRLPSKPFRSTTTSSPRLRSSTLTRPRRCAPPSPPATARHLRQPNWRQGRRLRSSMPLSRTSLH